MTLVFIDQDKLSVSKTNMRYGKKAPDVSDLLPTVRKRGVIQTLLVRPNCQDGHFEIVAGSRRKPARPSRYRAASSPKPTMLPPSRRR
jgi:ParB family chromosome partitioning protein